MAEHILCIAVCIAAVLGAAGEKALCQYAQTKPEVTVPAKSLQAEALKNFRPAEFPLAVQNSAGLASVHTKTTTGEVWLIAMQSPDLQSIASAGFSSNSIQNPGPADWPGVTITATFQVLSLQGSADFRVCVGKGDAAKVVFGDGSPGARLPTGQENVKASYEADRPGTYSVTTAPFTMKPRSDYRGYAWVEPGATNLRPCQAVCCCVKITSIKFSFP